MVGGWRVAIDESQHLGKSHQEAQPAEQTHEGEQSEETEPAP